MHLTQTAPSQHPLQKQIAQLRLMFTQLQQTGLTNAHRLQLNQKLLELGQLMSGGPVAKHVVREAGCLLAELQMTPAIAPANTPLGATVRQLNGLVARLRA